MFSQFVEADGMGRNELLVVEAALDDVAYHGQSHGEICAWSDLDIGLGLGGDG
jgi:hypothetical protein